ALPPDAAELVAERRQLERKARALTEVEKSLAAWRAQLEAQEERIGGAKQAQADRGQLEAELAAARLELERARSALSEAQAAQAAATASDDAEDDAEEERLARLESTLAAWETTLNDREAQLAARESAATADRQTRSRDEQQRVEAARRELERAQTDLATQQDTLARREAQLAEKERALAEADQALQARLASIAESESALQEQTVKLADQEAAYRQRQAELAALDRQIAELDANAAKKMAALAVFADPGAGPAAAPTVADDGPQITMIDPPLEVRSSGRRRSIQVRSNVAERQIIGRIDSSVPMLSLVVNDNPVEVSDSGVFRTAVPIDRDELPVLIVAVDERGRRKEIDFVVEREIAAAVQQIATTPGTDNSILPPMSRPPIDLGRFHALVIGNNAYTKLPPLETARNDASAVAEVLESRYGFEVTLLLDATRYDILSAMNKLRASLTENDNLLIYYAGHGELDEVNQRGHWLPVDAEPDSTANWISNVQLTDILNAMAAERIIIIADSCYSGSLTRSSLARLDAGMTLEARNAWIEALADKKARMALTSGGLAPVLDAGGGDNSIFARSLIDALSSNNDVLEGQRLYQQVAARVTYAAEAFAFEQVPQYAPIKFAGHESGEFFFVPKS
ncbi:MAG: caspase family protein, partial [Geminicoccaceae bacterium]|nr:caspase family protein [Geminicoccaceae bacterium]